MGLRSARLLSGLTESPPLGEVQQCGPRDSSNLKQIMQPRSKLRSRLSSTKGAGAQGTSIFLAHKLHVATEI